MKRKVTVRPGRAGALAGGIVGIFFVIIGFLVVVPQAGLFGIMWTAVAVFIVGSNLYNAFSEKGIASHTIEIDDDGNIDYAPGPEEEIVYRVDPGSTVEERLNRLNDLYDKRLVTSREYEEKRKEILKDL